MASRIKLRRGTATQWTTSNPVLADGEPGVETHTGYALMKVGDGVTAWNDLDYTVSDLSVVAKLNFGIDDSGNVYFDRGLPPLAERANFEIVDNQIVLTRADGATAPLLTLAGAQALFARTDSVPALYDMLWRSLLTLANQGGIPLSSTAGYVLAFTDQNGRMALGLRADGTLEGKFLLAAGSVTTTSLDPSLLARMLTPAPLTSTDSFSITDAAGRAALQVNGDGTIAAKLDAASIALVLAAIQPQLLPVGFDTQMLPLPITSGYKFSIVDLAGRMAFGTRSDGTNFGTIDKALNAPAPPYQPEDWYVSTIVDGGGLKQLVLNNRVTGQATQITSTGDHSNAVVRSDGAVTFTRVLSGVTSQLYVRISDSSHVKHQVLSQPNVPVWGDSLTNRGGIVNALQAAMSDLTVFELGDEGQTSVEIMARQGGYTAKTTGAVTIPTSGGVVVPVDIAVAWHESPHVLTGTLAGVHGTMTSAEDRTHTFTRDSGGSAVVVAIGTPFLTDDSATHRESTPIFFTGRNDVSRGQGSQQVIDATAAGVAFLGPLFKRFLVLSTTTGTTETTGTANYNIIATINTALAAAYGSKFVDIRRWLVDNAYALIAAQGLTPTTADDTAIAGDTIPPSLMLAGDGIHFNMDTQTAIGNYIYTRFQQMGWHA